MKEQIIRTMKFIGIDGFSRPVYKAVENNFLWKDINCGEGDIDLFSCGEEFEGEPECPIRKDIKIIFK